MESLGKLEQTIECLEHQKKEVKELISGAVHDIKVCKAKTGLN